MSRTQLHMLMPDPDEVYQISEESNGPHGFLVGYATTVSKVFAGQPLEITWKILHQERIMEIKCIVNARNVKILVDGETVLDKNDNFFRLSVQSRGLDLNFRQNWVHVLNGPLYDLRVGRTLCHRLKEPPRFLMTGTEYVQDSRHTHDLESGSWTIKYTTRDELTRTRIEGTIIQMTNELVASCGVDANSIRHRTAVQTRQHVTDSVTTLASSGTELSITAPDLKRGMTVALFLVHINVMDTNNATTFTVKTKVTKISDHPDDVHAVSVGDKRLAMAQVGLTIRD